MLKPMSLVFKLSLVVRTTIMLERYTI